MTSKPSYKKIIKECDEALARIPGFEETFGKGSVSSLKQSFEQIRAEAAVTIGRKK